MPDQRGNAAGVVIAEERRQLKRRLRPALVQRVGAEQLLQFVGPGRCRDTRRPPRARTRNPGRLAACRRACSPRCARGPFPCRDFAEDVEVRDAAAFARGSIAGTNSCQNSGLTCCAVSMRKPSTPILVDPLAVDLDHPRTTRGFSVKMSSRPTKSPIVLDSPRNSGVAAVVIVDRIVEPRRDA